MRRIGLALLALSLALPSALRADTANVAADAYTHSSQANTNFGSENSSYAIRGFVQDIGTAPSVGVYFADVVAPALQTRADFVERLFDSEVRPLVLDQVAPLDGRGRRTVELYRRELAGLGDQMRDYTAHLRDICDDLVRLGF